jgi:hypothetical protein
MPGKSHPAAKLQAETPLTPARSFRDEDLTSSEAVPGD